VNPNTATLPLTAGPLDPDFPLDPTFAAAGGGAGAGGGGAGTLAGVSTLPCLAFVQLLSDGLAGAAAPESGTTQTTSTSSSDSRSKTSMINQAARPARVESQTSTAAPRGNRKENVVPSADDVTATLPACA
jgi:hypothetical protein